MNRQRDKSISTSQDWHAQSIETIFKLLETSAEGLSKEEVSQRVAQYGHNKLPTHTTALS